MATVAELSAKFTADTSDLEAGTKRATGAISTMGGAIKTVFGTAGGFLLAQGIQHVVGGIGSLAGAGLDFEREMANVNSIAKLSAGELDALSQQVIGLAGDPRILAGPAQLAAGLYDIQGSGFVAQDALRILEQSALASTAGLTTTDVASRALTAALNAYGWGAEQAQHVSDVFFRTVDSGVITFEQLANNLGNTLPLASTLGVSIEELGAAYAQLTVNGVQASQAETQIAALMRSAVNPTQALKDAVLEKTGATVQDLIATEGMAGLLGVLMEATGGSTEALGELLGTQEAINAALILGKNNGEDYNAMIEDMESATDGAGATQEALNEQMKSARFAIAEMRKQVEIAATVFMGVLAPAISLVASWFSRLITEGLVPLLNYLSAVVEDGDLMNDWLTHLPGFIQPVVMTIGSLILAVQDVIDAFQALAAGDVSGFFRELQEAANTAFDALLQFANVTIDWVLDTGVPTIIGWVVDHASDVWNGIKALAGWAWDGLAPLGDIILDGIPKLGEALQKVANNVWGWIKEQLGLGPIVGDGTGINPIARDIPIGDVLLEGVAKLGEALQKVANNVWGWIQEQLGLNKPTKRGGSPITIGTVILDGVAELGSALKQVAQDIGGWIKKTYIQQSPKIDGLKITISALAFEAGVAVGSAVRDLISTVSSQIGAIDWGSALRNAMSGSRNIGRVIGELIREGIVAVAGFIGDVDWSHVASAIVEGLPGAIKAVALAPALIAAAILGIIGSAVLGVIEGLTGQTISWDGVAGALSGAITRAISGFTGFANNIKNTLIQEFNEAKPSAADLATMAVGAAAALAAAIPAAIGATVGFAAGIKDKVVQEFREAVPSAGDLADIGSQIAQALWDAIKSAAAGIFDIPSLITGDDGGGIPVDENGLPIMKGRQAVGFDLGSAGRGSAAGRLAQQQQTRLVIPPPDLSQFEAGMKRMAQVAQQAVQQTIAAMRPLAPQLQQITTQATTLVRTTFQTTLAQIPPLARSMAQQTVAGWQATLAPMAPQSAAIANQTLSSVRAALSQLPGIARSMAQQAASGFVGGLQALHQAAGVASGAVNSMRGILAGASSGAYGYGAAVGQQFASGLRASIGAVAAAAAELRAYLPSSPAKKGPLREPVSFDYVTDALARAMGQSAMVARMGARTVSNELAFGGGSLGSLAYAGRQNRLNGTPIIITLEPGKWQDVLTAADRGNRAYIQQTAQSRVMQMGYGR